MATKDDCLSFKKRQIKFVDSGDQYSNLNLNNQNHDCVFEEIFRPKNIAFDNKKSQNYGLSHSKDLRSETNSWNKFNKRSSTTFLNLSNDFEARNEVKKSKSANNSSLSLHIAAYENSTEVAANSHNRERADKRKWKNPKPSFTGSKDVIENLFEFPRQQENEKTKTPEVAQFKASQKLLNPNKSEAIFFTNLKEMDTGDMEKLLSDMENDDFIYVTDADKEHCLSDKQNNHLKEIDTIVNKRCMSDMKEYDITKEQKKFAAILELKSLFPIDPHPSLHNPENSLSSELIKERDQYHQQAEMYVKMIEELFQQRQHLLEKENRYQNGIQYFQQESQRATDVIKVVNDRYRDLLSDAEKNISEANEKINEMQTQHDKDTVTMRYKLLQQEVKLKSLNSQIVTLQTERLELMNMCDELVAKTGGRLSSDSSEKTVVIVPLKNPNL